MQFQFGEDIIRVNIKGVSDLLDVVSARFRMGEGFALATVNLDHLVKLSKSASFRTAYLAHDLIVADGNPIVWLSRLAKRPVELAPGSELILPLTKLAAEAEMPVALVGATQDTLDRAAAYLLAQYPDLNICAKLAPSQGFAAASNEASDILNQLNSSGARLCFLALGAPKQEELAARGRKICPSVGFASIGAGLDFLAGNQRRAPKLVQMFALEWFWRMLSNPLRLGPRYLRSFGVLPRHFIAALLLRYRNDG